MMSKRGNGAQRHELIVWTSDVNIFQLFRIEPLGPFDLWNDFVTSSFDVEAIDEVAANAGRKIGAHLLHVHAHGRNLVVIENNFGLRLVDLGVDLGREEEHSALHRL